MKILSRPPFLHRIPQHPLYPLLCCAVARCALSPDTPPPLLPPPQDIPLCNPPTASRAARSYSVEDCDLCVMRHKRETGDIKIARSSRHEHADLATLVLDSLRFLIRAVLRGAHLERTESKCIFCASSPHLLHISLHQLTKHTDVRHEIHMRYSQRYVRDTPEILSGVYMERYVKMGFAQDL